MPTMYGTSIPVIELTDPEMAIKMPAWFRLKSRGFIETPGTPWNAIEMAKNTTTVVRWHSAYEATTMNTPVKSDAKRYWKREGEIKRNETWWKCTKEKKKQNKSITNQRQ